MINSSPTIRTISIIKLAFSKIRFARFAIISVIMALVNISLIIQILENIFYIFFMLWISWPNKWIIINIKFFKQNFCFACNSINKFLRFRSMRKSCIHYFLTVFISSSCKISIKSPECLISFQNISNNWSINITNM